MATTDQEDDLSSEVEDTFVNEPPEDLKCPICLHILTDPCQTVCGHRFCLKCIEAVQKTDNPVCPIDRIAIGGGLFQDNAAKMQIRRLKIYCPFKCKGCDWKGDLSDKNDHLKSCPYSSRTCIHCGSVMAVSQIHEHQFSCILRSIKCDYCNKGVTFRDLQVHLDSCLLYPVPCPNGCGYEFPRSDIPRHCREDCSRELVACPLEGFGCNDKVPREDKTSHLNKCALDRISQLSMAVLRQNQEIDKLTSIVEKQQQVITELQDKCYPCQPQYTWKIDDIRTKIRSAQNKPNSSQQQQQPIYSPAFFTHEGGYKLRLCIFPAGDNNHGGLSLYFVIMKGPYDDILHWPFQKRVCLFLVNCKGGPNIVKDIHPDPRLHYFKKPTEPQNVGYGYPKFVPLSALLSGESDFVANETMFIRVIVVN